MGPARETTPEVILFDLGGVLMDFSGLHRLADITGLANDVLLREQWASDRWLHKFEQGRCTAAEFAQGVVADWTLDMSPTEFLEEFTSWPAGPFDGAIDLVSGLRGQIPMGCLSNTNPAHWQQHLDKWGVVDHFDWIFVSHELGLMKPDPKAYEHVINAIGLAPDRLLFLDDREDNVRAAIEHGINSVLVASIDQVRDAIALAIPGLDLAGES